MRRTSILAVLLLPVLGLGFPPDDSKVSGFTADFLIQLDGVQKQILDLEGAVPQEKFSWRPAEGVRSVGEVYLHIAFGNYFLLKLAGYEPPTDAGFTMDGKKWESSTTDRAKTAEVLKHSFEHVRGVVTKVTPADLEKKVKMFGNEVTVRNAMMTVLSHLHEHLGQSIAYARMNGVVPPWTAAEQAAQAKKDAK